MYAVGLVKDLEPLVSRIIQHTAISRIESGELSVGQLQIFGQEYFHYCKVFPRLLAAVATNTPDDQTRMNLIENLWEEHGEGVLEESHRELYTKFLKELGISIEEANQYQPTHETNEYRESCLSFCKDSNFLVGLGFLGPGTESFTDEEYKRILNGLTTYSCFSDIGLRFWSVHISLDEDHFLECAEAIEPWCLCKENLVSIEHGAKFALESELRFWDGIEKVLQ